MKTPPYLKAGDTVAIVATARKITKEELQPAIKLLKEWGLEVVLGDSIGATDNQFAGNDKIRTRDFQRHIDNSNIRAIWCARGGYGTVRIIDHIDFSRFKENPKWIIGYSDITILHSHIHNFNIETIHAQMCLEIEKRSQISRSSLKKVLFGYDYSINHNSKNKLNRQGEAEGELVGGNLSVLFSMCGSSSQIETSGKILFIEDLDEYLYHIDRMMQNLKRVGMLSNLQGLIVGGMSGMNDNTIPFGKTAEEIIYEAVEDYTYPVCFDFPAGHINDNRSLIFGRNVILKVKKDFNSLLFNNSN